MSPEDLANKILQMTNAPPPGRHRASRPRTVTLVIAGVFLLGMANAWRALGFYRQSSVLLELGMSPDPRLLMVLAAVWFFAFVTAAILLWRRQRVSRLLIPALTLVYGLYRLSLDWFYDRDTLNLTLLFYLAVILLVMWVLTRRSTSRYLRVANANRLPESRTGRKITE